MNLSQLFNSDDVSWKNVQEIAGFSFTESNAIDVFNEEIERACDSYCYRVFSEEYANPTDVPWLVLRMLKSGNVIPYAFRMYAFGINPHVTAGVEVCLILRVQDNDEVVGIDEIGIRLHLQGTRELSKEECIKSLQSLNRIRMGNTRIISVSCGKIPSEDLSISASDIAEIFSNSGYKPDTEVELNV